MRYPLQIFLVEFLNILNDTEEARGYSLTWHFFFGDDIVE